MTISHNAKPIFEFAKANGDAKIIDRIIIKILPLLIENKIELKSDSIEESDEISVPSNIFSKIIEIAEEMTGKTYTENN